MGKHSDFRISSFQVVHAWRFLQFNRKKNLTEDKTAIFRDNSSHAGGGGGGIAICSAREVSSFPSFF